MGRSGRFFSRLMRALRGLYQRDVGGDLWPVVQGDRHQVVELARRVDQRHLGVVVLHRLDHRPWVQSQDARQLGAADPPVAAVLGRPLLHVGQHVAGPLNLHRRDELSGEAGDAVDEVAPALDAVQRTGVSPPGLMDPEIGFGRAEEDVVLGRLHVEMPRVEHLAGDEGLEDGIGHIDVQIGPGPGVEVVKAGIEHEPLVDVGGAPPSWRV